MYDAAGCFTNTVKRLPPTWHVVSFDFPGHGDSDFPTNQQVNGDLLLGSLVTVVNELDWDDFHLG